MDEYFFINNFLKWQRKNNKQKQLNLQKQKKKHQKNCIIYE